MRRVTRETCAIYRIESAKRPRIEGEARTEVEGRGRSPSNEAPTEGEARMKAPLQGLPGRAPGDTRSMRHLPNRGRKAPEN